ncbi:thioesterase family protein [Arthrobacter ginkgonis]|uniref:Thioesterase family protein n=1 Tax=Arthrobacter ginkgonis TaxID=1630594 RepID=A0ABP7C260_9MICC
MSHTNITVALRWSDQDANGHLNNARIVTIMEEARVRWTRAQPEFASFRGGVVVASLNVDYLAQADYLPEMVVAVGIERVGTKSFTVRHVGYQGEQAVFDGRTVIVPMAEDGRSSRALTAAERAGLEANRFAEVPAD